MTKVSDKNLEKFAYLGRITRGIIHDLNNSLAAIKAFSSFLSDDLDPKSEQYIFAENIKKAGLQIESLTEQIRALSMELGTDRDVQIDIVGTIAQFAQDFSNNLPENQKVSFSNDIDEAFIKMPSFQFNVMISNIIKNAIQSLSNDAGKVTIHISKGSHQDKIELEEKYLFIANLTPDNHPKKRSSIKIDVIDTGCGMDEVTLNLAPSPHFTTKSADIAHGLGLSISSQIVNNLGGTISIATTPKIGTKTTIVLPIKRGN
jgi:signal transduction histidine kinase